MTTDFIAGMEAAAKLVDGEVASAEALLAEFSACDLKNRMALVRDHLQMMAQTIRQFAANAEWCKETLAQRPRCSGCGNEIDPDVCGCGLSINGSGHDGHNPIPMGCACYRAKG